MSPVSVRLGTAVIAAVSLAVSAGAAGLPTGFTETTIASGLVNPTAMSFAPDGRLFVCEQGGRLRIVKNGSLLAQPFVSVSVNSSGERGLLGVAIDPEFASNRFVYVYYTTASSPIHNRLSRFTANAADLDTAPLASEAQILNLPTLSATNHNGGAIHFGPDAKLYIAVGENAVSSNAPSLGTTLGKMLRINKDGSIPPDNPFVGQTTGINQAIWARGLRNPFTFAFQPGTGRMHINDVGQNTWEEVNVGNAGANYGWPATEGPNPPGQAGVTYPVHSYENAGSNCAIVGAAFYNPPVLNFPASFVGRYFFGDFCGGFIRTLSPPSYTASSGFASGISSLVDIAVGPDGLLYYLARGGGAVVRVRFTQSEAPAITQHPMSQTVAVGQSATFQVAASGTAPLLFQWQRDGLDIPGANASTYTLGSAGLGDNGAAFRAVVTNDFGSATSNAAILTVTNNTPPVGTITMPADGATYAGGQSFVFAATGTDAEDGTLPPGAFTWRVDFHHDTHTHPFVPPMGGDGGGFIIANRGETSTNVFYRVVLTVRDSGGLTHTTTRDLRPRLSNITLATDPPGLQLTLDGQPVTAPLTTGSVEGVIRALGAVSPQTVGGTTYTFLSWSDGGAANHEVATPVDDTTFTARFQVNTTPTVVFSDEFGSDLGWVRNSGGGDTAGTGLWQRGDPQATTSGGATIQLGTGDRGTTNCLTTGRLAGSSAGANDVDGGLTSIQSPAIVLPASGTLTLSLAFYFSHLANSSADDFFRVIVVDGTARTTVLEERGTAAVDAGSWATRTVDLTAFAGRTIRLRLEAADNAGGSLVEAGVDTVTITRR
jgi:glucose/arabinose dehydrogenase